MAEFLVESYVARTDADAFARGAKRSREAADVLTRAGTAVRLLRCMFIPEEETALYVWEAASTDDVREAARRAAIDVSSLVETITDFGFQDHTAVASRDAARSVE